MTDRLISVVDDDHQFVPLPPGTFKPGVIFSMRRILRFAIVLLGLQLSFAQLVKVSTVGLAIIAVTLAAAFVFTMRLGRWLGIDRKLTQLIASGTSLCGASAVIATNTVTRSDEDVTYAVRRNPETPNSTLAGASDMGSTAANFKSDFHTLSRFFACRCRTAVPDRGKR